MVRREAVVWITIVKVGGMMVRVEGRGGDYGGEGGRGGGYVGNWRWVYF